MKDFDTWLFSSLLLAAEIFKTSTNFVISNVKLWQQYIIMIINDVCLLEYLNEDQNFWQQQY